MSMGSRFSSRMLAPLCGIGPQKGPAPASKAPQAGGVRRSGLCGEDLHGQTEKMRGRKKLRQSAQVTGGSEAAGLRLQGSVNHKALDLPMRLNELIRPPELVST
jgi:hypothetical protein